MSFSRHGRHDARFSRASHPRRFSAPKSSIHPSKYVNTGVKKKVIEDVQVTHQFTEFGLDSQLLQNVTRHGYITPTPIQDQAIPVMLSGRDVLGLANTGTGKTAAFLLPLIHRILNDPEQGVLIVVPTRELALQIRDELTRFLLGMRLRQSLCIGGMNITMQIMALRKNPHFVIGTPGRLKDLIQRRELNTALFTNIVLDEVDRMLDIGFIRDIRYLVSQLPKQRHSYFFSATMTREVEDVARSFLSHPVKISVKTQETSEHIYQDVVRIQPGQAKVEVLYDLLKRQEFKKVIVFGRTKHGINKLEEALATKGLRVCAIHGNKSQNARQRSLEMFKRGATQALLATDVAARGIDICDVTHVINYDEPGTYEDYIHRIGRTGRAGKTGMALTFVSV